MRKIIFWILSLLWMMIIFAFSAKTANGSTVQSMFITEKIVRLFIDNPSIEFIDLLENVVRKLAHFTEYFILGIFVYNLLRSYNFTRKKSAFAIALCFVYAVSDEVHQFFVPGRACRFLDMLIDTAGSAFSYLCIQLLSFLTKRK